MASVETRKVVNKVCGTEMTINTTDFDPEQHEPVTEKSSRKKLADEEPAKEPEKKEGEAEGKKGKK